MLTQQMTTIYYKRAMQSVLSLDKAGKGFQLHVATENVFDFNHPTGTNA